MHIVHILKDSLQADHSWSAILLCGSDYGSNSMSFAWNLYSWLLHLDFPLRAGCSPIFFYTRTQQRGWSVPVNQNDRLFSGKSKDLHSTVKIFPPCFLLHASIEAHAGQTASHSPGITKSHKTFMKVLKQGLSLISHRIKWKRSSAFTFFKLIKAGYCSSGEREVAYLTWG